MALNAAHQKLERSQKRGIACLRRRYTPLRTNNMPDKIMRPIFALALLPALMVVDVNAQKLGKADFRVGMLQVNGKFDLISLSKDFGYPARIDTFIETHRTPSPETTYVYRFDSLTVYVERFGIRLIEFISTRLTTHRGVRIGDTVEKVHSLYGESSQEEWLGCPSSPSYFKKDSTLGLNFCISNGRVVKIYVGWGRT